MYSCWEREREAQITQTPREEEDYEKTDRRRY